MVLQIRKLNFHMSLLNNLLLWLKILRGILFQIKINMYNRTWGLKNNTNFDLKLWFHTFHDKS